MSEFLIYRVEDQYNVGPYSNKTRFYRNELKEEFDSHDYGHPTVCNEFEDIWDYDWYAGFCSMDLLVEWFSDKFRTLLHEFDKSWKYEHMIAIYVVDSKHVHYGNQQLIFRQNEAELLTKIPITSKKLF